MVAANNLTQHHKVGRDYLKFYFSHFSEKFSTKIWLANLGKCFRKFIACRQKSLAIGDWASANEYTVGGGRGLSEK